MDHRLQTYYHKLNKPSYIRVPLVERYKKLYVNKQIRCMLIEDDVDDQEIFCLALQKVNKLIECDMAIDGVEAIQILTSNDFIKPDYIFIDVNMPKMDGIECLRQIKEMPDIRDVRIFMFSTSSAPKLIDNSKALGANGFIVKPPSIHELTKKLAELFQTGPTIPQFYQ